MCLQFPDGKNRWKLQDTTIDEPKYKTKKSKFSGTQERLQKLVNSEKGMVKGFHLFEVKQSIIPMETMICLIVPIPNPEFDWQGIKPGSILENVSIIQHFFTLCK